MTGTVPPLNSRARKIYAQTPREVLVPFGLGHFLSLGGEPDDFFQALGRHGVSLQEAAPAEHRMTASECNHLGGKFQKPLLFRIQLPVEVKTFVVLAIGVVVAPLGMAELIPAEHHGHALR